NSIHPFMHSYKTYTKYPNIAVSYAYAVFNDKVSLIYHMVLHTFEDQRTRFKTSTLRNNSVINRIINYWYVLFSYTCMARYIIPEPIK
ncbi:hypothetical protein ALC53_00263, partial [Atta colombica]